MTLYEKGWIIFILMNLLKWQRSSSGVSLTSSYLLQKWSRKATLQQLMSNSRVPAMCIKANTCRATFTVFCQDPVIRAVFGEDIILQCQLDPPINATDMEVRWFTTDFTNPVHLYRNKKDDYQVQNTAYRERTVLSKEGLVTGTISLSLRNIGFTDEGMFTCLVTLGTWDEESKIEVKVGAFNEPELELHGYKLSGFYYGIRLLCKSEGWYPRPEIHWTNENGENLTTLSYSTIEQNAAGFFTVESHIKVIKGSGIIVSCVLKNTIPTTAKTSIKISDAAFPPLFTFTFTQLVRILIFIIPLSAVGIFFYNIMQEHAFFHEHCEGIELYINETTTNQSIKNMLPLLYKCKKIRCPIWAKDLIQETRRIGDQLANMVKNMQDSLTHLQGKTKENTACIGSTEQRIADLEDTITKLKNTQKQKEKVIVSIAVKLEDLENSLQAQ
nr:PREDICTED: butyrophilin subfamily 3 member A2-like [Latimeria chalumnae]|eukprot:XP_014353388.1 PREDICTED: butyrophilin subfamily 3 member A2-like [Latimeria chalumnae]